MSQNILRKHRLLEFPFHPGLPAQEGPAAGSLSRLGWLAYRAALITTGLLWICMACTLCGCSPMNGWVMNESGLAYYNRGDFEAARYEFERALMDNPYRADYAYNVAKAMQKQGDASGAEQMYQYALTLDPGHELAYRGLSDMLIAQGRESDAQMLLQAWAETQPYAPGSNIELARYHQRTGNLPAAEQNLARALRINPNDPRALNQMGMIYEQTGQPAMAAAYYQQSLILQPMQPEVQSRLSGIGWTPGASPALAMAHKVPLTDPTINGGVSFAGGPVASPAQIVTTSGTMAGPRWPYPQGTLAMPTGPATQQTMSSIGPGGSYVPGPSATITQGPLTLPPAPMRSPAIPAPGYEQQGPVTGGWMPAFSNGEPVPPAAGFVPPQSVPPMHTTVPVPQSTVPQLPQYETQLPLNSGWAAPQNITSAGLPAVPAF